MSWFKFSKSFIFLPVTVFTALVFPFLSYAQTVGGIFNKLSIIVSNYIVPFLMGLAVMLFLFGVVKFIAAAGNPEKIKTAKHYILWGLVALFFLVSFWAFIHILLTTFFGSPDAPTKPATWPPTAF